MLQPTVAVVNNGPRKGGTPDSLAVVQGTAVVRPDQHRERFTAPRRAVVVDHPVRVPGNAAALERGRRRRWRRLSRSCSESRACATCSWSEKIGIGRLCVLMISPRCAVRRVHPEGVAAVVGVQRFGSEAVELTRNTLAGTRADELHLPPRRDAS